MNIFKKTIKAEDVAKAFNKHKNNLRATETGCCGNKFFVVVNEMVLLRRMMEDLGFSEEEINKNLHKT